MACASSTHHHHQRTSDRRPRERQGRASQSMTRVVWSGRETDWSGPSGRSLPYVKRAGGLFSWHQSSTFKTMLWPPPPPIKGLVAAGPYCTSTCLGLLRSVSCLAFSLDHRTHFHPASPRSASRFTASQFTLSQFTPSQTVHTQSVHSFIHSSSPSHSASSSHQHRIFQVQVHI